MCFFVFVLSYFCVGQIWFVLVSFLFRFFCFLFSLFRLVMHDGLSLTTVFVFVRLPRGRKQFSVNTSGNDNKSKEGERGTSRQAGEQAGPPG